MSGRIRQHPVDDCPTERQAAARTVAHALDDMRLVAAAWLIGAAEAFVEDEDGDDERPRAFGEKAEGRPAWQH